MVVKKATILLVMLLIRAGLILVGCLATRSGYELKPVNDKPPGATPAA